MRPLHLILLILGASLLISATHSTAADERPVVPVLEQLMVDSGGIFIEGQLDWTDGTITVTGEGVVADDITHPVRRRLLGFRAARVDAYRKLLEVVGGVRVDARTTVSMAMVASDSIQTQVAGLVRGARVVTGSQREEDGLYLLDLRLDMHGDLSGAVLSDSVTTAAVPDDLPERDSVVVFVPPKQYTGLVVDARGLDLQASLSPRIVDDSGRVIYAATQVDRQYAVRIGVVGYAGDLHQAVVSDRVGGESAHPFLAQAINVSGLYNSDVVVTRDMGTRIRMADMRTDFLADCRVVFVVGDKPLPPTPEPVFSAAASSDSTAVDSVSRLLPLSRPTGDFLDSILEARALGDSLPDTDLSEGSSP